MKKIDLSIIIVSYNTQELLNSCLRSVRGSEMGDYTYEILVYDNASVDGTVGMLSTEFPEAVVFPGPENIGFAAGNNRAIIKSTGRYILLLNSDTVLKTDTLQTMISFMDATADAGAGTCKLVLPDGSMDPACHRGFPTPWTAITYFLKLEKVFPKSRLFGRYHMGYAPMHEVHEIDVPSGAFFMVRRNVIEDIGLLDEDYFMYAEDIDWAYRMKTNGYRIVFNPHTTCIHVKKQSGRNSKDRIKKIKTDIAFHENNWLFYKKHLARIYGPVISLLVGCVYATRIALLKVFHI